MTTVDLLAVALPALATIVTCVRTAAGYYPPPDLPLAPRHSHREEPRPARLERRSGGRAVGSPFATEKG